MADLKTDYKSDVLSPSMDGKRKYNLVDSEGNVVVSNVHIEDVSSYSQLGDNYSADDINAQNEAINKNSDDIAQLNTDLSAKADKSYVEANDTATPITIGTTLVTLDSDGYLEVSNDGFYLYGSVSNNRVYISASSGQSNGCFARKGMRVQRVSTTGTLRFFPLV